MGYWLSTAGSRTPGNSGVCGYEGLGPFPSLAPLLDHAVSLLPSDTHPVMRHVHRAGSLPEAGPIMFSRPHHHGTVSHIGSTSAFARGEASSPWTQCILFPGGVLRAQPSQSHSEGLSEGRGSRCPCRFPAVVLSWGPERHDPTGNVPRTRREELSCSFVVSVTVIPALPEGLWGFLS